MGLERRSVRVFAVSILLASLVLMGSGVLASGAASASPSSCYPPGSTSCTGTLKVTPGTVVRGGTVTITGQGFAAGANVTINVCNIKKFTTVASDVGLLGQIDASITMPDNAPLGACKFTATGLGTNKQTLTLTTTVIVKSASQTGTLKVTPSTVVRGGTVTITGKGFTAGAKVTINVCNIKKFTTVASKVGLLGQILASITMPDNAPLGACKFTATGPATNSQTLTLTATVTVKTVLTGTLKVTPSTVVRGGTATITGKGFTAGANVTINVCNIKKFTTVASNVGLLGQILALITMPDNAPLGACKFTATGLATNSQTLTLTATVTVKSASKTVLTLSATKVTYGDEQVEQLSLTVSPEFAGPTPTGKVSISESKTTLCVITLSSGKGSCSLSAKEIKTAGTYRLVATYGGSLKVAGSFTMETLTVVE